MDFHQSGSALLSGPETGSASSIWPSKDEIKPKIEDLTNFKYTINSVRDIDEIYSYANLKKFENITKFRAGIVLINHPDPLCGSFESEPAAKQNDIYELLIVREKGAQKRTKPPSSKFITNWGVPKGSAEPSDPSALYTALRELYEETGITIAGLNHPNIQGASVSLHAINAQILKPTFIVIRKDSQSTEMLIYFVIICKERPNITICDELADYEWIDLQYGLRGIKNVSAPTYKLFQQIDRLDLYSHTITDWINPD
jgi:8-oxo-dGTP pyrophosphatase MutT (NUDIX family)